MFERYQTSKDEDGQSCSIREPTVILLKETHSIPVVFVYVGDPVGSGYVTNLARPGGNATGFSALDTAIGGKWLELLKEIAPDVSRVAVILHPETPPNVGFLCAAGAAAPSFGVKVGHTPPPRSRGSLRSSRASPMAA